MVFILNTIQDKRYKTSFQFKDTKLQDRKRWIPAFAGMTKKKK